MLNVFHILLYIRNKVDRERTGKSKPEYAAEYFYPIIGLFVETGLEVFLFIMALILNKRYKPG